MRESTIKKKRELSQKVVLLTSPQTFKTLQNISLSDILEENVDQKYFLSEKMVLGIMKSNYRERKPQDKEEVSSTLKIGGGHPLPRVRRLTPTECERLQGFPDGWTEGVSDTQRYKCLGNAVTVNVVYEVARRLE